MTSKRVAVASLVAVLLLASGATGDDERYGATVETLDRATDAADWAAVASLFSTDAVASFVHAYEPDAARDDMPIARAIAQERAARAFLAAYRAERGPLQVQQSSEGPLVRRSITETAATSEGRTITMVSDESYVFAETPSGVRIVKLLVRIEKVDVRPQIPADLL